MIFSEIYGSYFNAVAKILETAVNGTLTQKDITDIVLDKAFGESIINLPVKIKSSNWGLLTDDLKTSIKNVPKMPLTTLQKRWLRAIMSDPRIKLFGIDMSGLEDVEPLYSQETFVYFDRYSDGDPYTDETYIRNFQTVLKALKEHRRLNIRFVSQHGVEHEKQITPYRLEYSPQDDKFRLLSKTLDTVWIINMARVTECSIGRKIKEEATQIPVRKREIVIELTDERNALERAMFHFSHLEKKTERIDDNRYRITLWYDKDDETEMLIRVIAFGPVLKVIEPERFIGQIKERLLKQKNLNV